MISEIYLLELLRKREMFDRYKDTIKPHVLTDESNVVLKEISLYYDTFPLAKEIVWPEFATWFQTIRHPTWLPDKKAVYERIFMELMEVATLPPVVDIISHFIKQDALARLIDHSYKMASGDAGSSITDLKGVIGELEGPATSSTPSPDIILGGLTELLDTVVRSGGLEWRLEDLNVMVGPLHQGDMVIVGARVETGKTSFITSEVTHMVGQLPPEKKVIFFNNEEAGKKIKLRLYESGLNKSVKDLLADETKCEAEYAKLLGGDANRIIVVHPKDGRIHKSLVESMCREHNPGIIVFNVLDKIYGFEKESMNETDKIARLSWWARELANTYGVVFCVVQADGSAEGQKWIYSNQLYMSKTKLPGEADLIVTIGKSHDPAEENRRFIMIPKNKLPGGARTDPTRKHGRAEVEFDGERGRYKTFIGTK